ncbi:MAG: ADP-ribosyl-[dinitrogen reductase] hydrolase [Thermoleophilaceae bacterium]|jgi:ADP-ribosyl-[dinitrogen reductase] hydrolase|nr:ADP-ribosyl-[dinitrogen reductase] hydrolase [Thermoleophilaceae bacterium]
MATVNQDKAVGALLGLAVGDALGAPVEGVSADDLGGKHTEMTGGGLYGLRPGQGTGDTDMTLRLAASLVEAGGFDPDRVLGSYIGWYRDDPPGMSEHMRQVLGSVDGGADAYRATSAVHFDAGANVGNGAIMRATPIGIAFAGREDALRDATLADAALTHFDPLPGKVALLHNQVVSWALTGGPPLVFAQLKDPEWLDDRIEDVVIPATAGVLGYAVALSKSESGSALTAIAIALAAFFNADDFEQGLIWAVNLGGDTDTNGAVTGALLGARFGTAAIPERWLTALERRAELEGVGRQLAAMAG